MKNDIFWHGIGYAVCFLTLCAVLAIASCEAQPAYAFCPSGAASAAVVAASASASFAELSGVETGVPYEPSALIAAAYPQIAAPVPEPAAWALLLGGAALLALARLVARRAS